MGIFLMRFLSLVHCGCCTDCLKWSACKKKKENSLRDLLMHHLSSHFLKVVFCALKLFAVLADFPIVRLISFAWAFIFNLLLSFGESLKSRLLFYTTQLGCNSFWRSIFTSIKFRYCEKTTKFEKNSPLFLKITL